MMNNDKKYMTAKQVSEYLQIPLPTVYRLITQNKIKSAKIGGSIRCFTEDVHNYEDYGTTYIFNKLRKNQSPKDERENPRINTELNCRYSLDLGSNNIINEGIMRNLSLDGLFLENHENEPNEIHVDDPVNLMFVLPLYEHNNKEINVNGRVRRKQDNGFAIKFRQVNERLKEDLKEYIG